MHVDTLCCDCCHVAALPGLLLNLSNLLPLLTGRCDFSTQDDVPDLRLSQSVGVHIVLLGIVSQNEVLQGNLNL